MGTEYFLRSAYTSCLYLSQSAFFMLTWVRRRLGLEDVFICNLMRIGRWSELRADRISGELGHAFGDSGVVDYHRNNNNENCGDDG